MESRIYSSSLVNRFTLHNGVCATIDSCDDYPLTSCDFPGAAYCSKCPSDSSKMKLEVCAPTYDSFAPHEDERGVTYWIKTDGTCPEGAICAPANITWYTKSANTCIPNEHNNKIIGCKGCYKKANMGPECVYDASYCSDVTYTLTLNANAATCIDATHTMHVGEQFQTILNPPSGCSSQYFDGWYTSKSGGTKYDGSNTMPAKDLTLYAHWRRSPSTNGYCHVSNVGPACYLIYGTTNRNSSSRVTFSSTYNNSEAYNERESYCNAISNEETCSSQGILKYLYNGDTLIKPVTLPYSIDSLLIGAQSTKACCEWAGPN